MNILYTTSNIFDIPLNTAEAVCVTTNGMIKKNGQAVMGAGIAKEANTRFHLADKLADYITRYGNRPFFMGLYKNDTNGNNFNIITFPTKHDWRNDSDLELIRKSAENLVRICDNRDIKRCYLTPVGCANGHLDWESQVKPVIAPILDNRFTIVFRENNVWYKKVVSITTLFF